MSNLNDYRKNLETLVEDTLRLTGDPLGERWSSTRAAEAINDTVLDFNLRVQTIREEINVQLKEDIFEYDIKTRVEEAGTLRLFCFPIRVGFSGRNAPAFTPVTLLDIDLVGYSANVWYASHLSPGKLTVITPSADGAAAGDADPYKNNIQVLFCAEPTIMEADDDFPDSMISILFHQGIPYGAAIRLLHEGTLDDLALADQHEAEYRKWTSRAIGEQWRGETDYGGCYPA